LGRIGHWLIDGASAEDRATVLGDVPVVPRFLLLHGFRRAYRRLIAACWEGAPPRAGSVQKVGRSAVCVAADVDAVWDVVADVGRVGEWSHECMRVAWLGGATSARAEARFRGRNRHGVFRWGRVCEIEKAEPYDLVWSTVPTALYPDSTVWMIRLCPIDGGTEIEQTFSVVRAPKVLELLYAVAIPAHRDRTKALTADLRRLGALAESSGARRAAGAA